MTEQLTEDEVPGSAKSVADAAAAELAERLFMVRGLLARALAPGVGALAPGGPGTVTPHQIDALECLLTGGRRMSDLADQLGVTRAAATALGERMVQQGLVERQPNPTNRREVLLEPTSAGIETVERYREFQRERVLESLEGVSREQMQSVVAVMEELVAALSERLQ